MKHTTKHLLAVMLLISAICCLSGLTACAPRAGVVIPDSRELVDLKDGSAPRPGWYGISGGYLRDIFIDLDKCKK